MTTYLEPLFDQIVVKELEPEQMRRSGLVVPIDRLRDYTPPQEGIVIDAGPGLDWWKQHDIEMPVQPGDHVMFPSNAGVWVEVEEERLLVLRVGALLGVVREKPEPVDFAKGADALRDFARRLNRGE